jgi:hypothetical protein
VKRSHQETNNLIIEFAKNPDATWDKTVGGGIQIKYFSRVRVSNSIIRNNIAVRNSCNLDD